MAPVDDQPQLSRVERAALALARTTQESESYKRFQYRFLRRVAQPFVRRTVGPRIYADNLQPLLDWNPDRGVVFAANHRSFFDQWLNMYCLYSCRATWPWRLYFPVRSNFFYEHPAGVAINYLMGAGVMYPPIFRERNKAQLTRDAVDRVIEFLRLPGTLVGVHPEGTRGKGPDPYEVLPAQPGIGQIVLQARPIVIPFFINGVGNDLPGETRRTYQHDSRRTAPIILVYGEPVDYSEFTQSKPRVALYKKCSDLLRDKIIELQAREQHIRAACARGDIGNDDPGWVHNHPRSVYRNNRNNTGARQGGPHQ